MKVGTLEIEMMANVARLNKDMDTAKQSVGGAMASVNKAVGEAKAALAGLGIGLSVGQIVLWQKSLIDGADAMNDMTQRIGINIRQLGGWTLAAGQSGTTMDTVAKGVKGLSAYLAENSAKLRAAGISATDADGAMTQLADLFAAMPDGVQKTNLAVQLFGKSGMDMIPMLNLGSAGLAKAQEKAAEYSRRLEALAPLADEFNDQLEELALQSKAAGMNITNFFMPGLIGLSTWLNDVSAGGKRMETAFEFMSEKSPLFAGLLKFHNLVSSGKKMGWSGPGSPWDQNVPVDEKAIMAQLAAEIAISDKQVAARDRANKLLDPVGTDAYKSIKKHADDYVRTLEKETAQTGLDATQKKMLDASLVAVALKTDKERLAVMAAALAWADATRIQAEAEAVKKMTAESIAAETKVLQDHADELNKELAAAERALEIYGLTASQIQSLTIARLEDQHAMVVGWDSQAELAARLEKEIEQRRKIRNAMQGVEAKDAAKKMVDDTTREWQRGWEETDRFGRETFVSWAREGGNAAEKIGDALETALLSAIYEASLKPIAFQIYNSVTGGAPGASGGSSGGALGSLSNAASLTSMYNAFATSGVGTAVGLSAAAVPGLMGPTLTGGALGGATLTSAGTAGAGAMGAISTAIPWIAAAVLAYQLLAKPGGGPKQEGNYSDAYGSGMPGYGQNGPLTEVAKSLTTAVESSYRDVVALFGKLPADLTGGAFISKDPAGSAATQLDQSLFLNGRQVYRRNDMFNGSENVGRSDAELQSAMEQSSALALIAALEATDGLPAIVEKYLDSLRGVKLTSEEAAAAINKVKQLDAVIDAFDYLGVSSDRLTESLVGSFGGLDQLAAGLVSYNENFFSEEEKRAKGISQLTEQLAALNIVMPQTTDLSRDWYADQVEIAAAMGASGESTFAALIKMNAQFAAVVPAAELASDSIKAVENSLDEIASERQRLQDQLDEMTMSSTQLLSKQREALDASNRGLFDQINELTAAAAATQAMVDSLSSYRNSIGSVMQSLGTLSGADSLQTGLSVAQTNAANALTALNEAASSTYEGLRALTLDDLTNAQYYQPGDIFSQISPELQALVTGALDAAAGVVTAQQAITNAAAQAARDAATAATQAATEAANEIAKVMQKIAAERENLQTRFDNATMTQAQLLQKQRDALDESNRALFDQVLAVEAANDAQRAATDAAKDAQKAVADAMLEASRKASEAANNYKSAGQSLLNSIIGIESTAIAARAAADAARNRITDGYLAAQDKVIAAQQRINDLMGQTAEQMRGFATGLRDLLDTLLTTDLGGQSKAFQYSNLQAQFAITSAQAKAGDTTALGKLNSMVQPLLEAGQRQSASLLDYQRIVARVAGTLQDVATLTDGRSGPLAQAVDPLLKAQQDLADAQRDAVKWGRAAAESGAALVKAEADYLADWRIAAADAAQADADLVSALGKLDAAGVRREALDQFLTSTLIDLGNLIGAYQSAQTASAAAATQAAILAAQASVSTQLLTQQSGSASWSVFDPISQTGQGGSVSRSFAVGTSYVPYDMTARIHTGEEITPRPYVDAQSIAREETNELLQRLLDSNDSLKTELAGARAELKQIKKSNQSIEEMTEKWDVVGLPPERP